MGFWRLRGGPLRLDGVRIKGKHLDSIEKEGLKIKKLSKHQEKCTASCQCQVHGGGPTALTV